MVFDPNSNGSTRQSAVESSHATQHGTDNESHLTMASIHRMECAYWHKVLVDQGIRKKTPLMSAKQQATEREFGADEPGTKTAYQRSLPITG